MNTRPLTAYAAVAIIASTNDFLVRTLRVMRFHS
jgi:hypothetical protein